MAVGCGWGWCECVGLVYIDLDGFKAVNDRMGHRTGDEVLSQVAWRMRQALAKNDFLCRVGGDEFVAVLKQAGDIDEVLARIEPMLGAIREPIVDFREPIRLDASVGVAIFPDDGVRESELMAVADERMYARKVRRRGQE